MKTHLVRIGNALGIRIPKRLLAAVGLAAPRSGWRADAELLRARGEAGLLDEPVPTAFDDAEWV